MFSIVSLTQEINSEMFLADLCSFTFSLCSPHCCLPVSLFSSSSPRIGFCHGLFLAFLCSSGSWPRFVSAPSLPPLQGDHRLYSAPERLVLVLPALLQGRSSHQGSATCCYQNLKLLLSFLPPPPTPRQAAGQRTPWLLGCAEGRQGRATGVSLWTVTSSCAYLTHIWPTFCSLFLREAYWSHTTSGII